jgi:hypothetical protein
VPLELDDPAEPDDPPAFVMVPPGGFQGSSDEHAGGTKVSAPSPKNNGIELIRLTRVALLVPTRERELFIFASLRWI